MVFIGRVWIYLLIYYVDIKNIFLEKFSFIIFGILNIQM